MATLQSNFNLRPGVGFPGMRANTEPENVISRTVEDAAGLGFGQPAWRGTGDHGCIAGLAFAATGAGSAAAGNVGTGAITASPAVASPAKQGRYVIVLTATGATAPWVAYDPDGRLVGHGVVASAATIDGVGPFTIANAGTMTAGDTYYIDTAFTANAKLLGFNVYDPGVPAVAAAGTPDLTPQYQTASLMNEGVLWVTAGATVTQGQRAYWKQSNGLYTASAADIVLSNSIVFDTGGGNGDLVRLAIRKRIV